MQMRFGKPGSHKSIYVVFEKKVAMSGEVEQIVSFGINRDAALTRMGQVYNFREIR